MRFINWVKEYRLSRPVRLWIRALRSGRFEQGTGVLHQDGKDDRYCCLGVACVVYNEHHRSNRLEVTTEDYNDQPLDEIEYDGETEMLPDRVRDWLGLGDKSGSHRYPNVHGVLDYEELTTMNDDGVTFDEIADRIASRPRELFREDGS